MDVMLDVIRSVEGYANDDELADSFNTTRSQLSRYRNKKASPRDTRASKIKDRYYRALDHLTEGDPIRVGDTKRRQLIGWVQALTPRGIDAIYEAVRRETAIDMLSDDAEKAAALEGATEELGAADIAELREHAKLLREKAVERRKAAVQNDGEARITRGGLAVTTGDKDISVAPKGSKTVKRSKKRS